MTSPPHGASIAHLQDERRFEFLVSGISDYAIYLLDPAGYVNSWNAGAQRFKGYLPEEIIGSHFSVFYSEDDRANGLPARALEIAAASGRFEAEGWRVRKDGSRFWASVVIDAIFRDDKQLLGFAKITRDITERKTAQLALRESEERFRLLVQGVTDYAIYMLSPEGIITNWNAGAARIKGYHEDEVIGTHFSRFYSPEDQAVKLPDLALKQAAGQGKFEQEGWRIRKDGSRFWAHVVIDPIRNELGALIGYGKVTRDVTERKIAAQTLEQAAAALHEAQKMEAIGQLTGGIAHDFNNLLGVLSSGLDLLSLRLSEAGDLKILGSMQKTVERGATLTQQLLSFARQQPLTLARHDLNALITGFESVLRRAATSAISFQLLLSSRLDAVMLDASRFESALLNLVVNARDAMPAGGELIISTRNVMLESNKIGVLPAGAYVRVSVSDNGCGMSPEVKARAFDPFFTSKGVGKGTGLGLSQVHGYVAQSGGDIVIDSEAGKGATFAIYLPAIAGDGGQVADETDPGRETVLIVEDDPALMEVAGELFRSMGFDVFTAGNGEDALKILERTKRVDLLFSDIMMPGINGIQLARIVKTTRPDINIILVSGYSAMAPQDGTDLSAEFKVLKKPYRLADLVKRLRELE